MSKLTDTKLKINYKELEDVLERQKKFDEYVMNKNEVEYNYYTFDQVKTAFIVELGEFLNELPSLFKYWKSKAKDKRKEALEEFADCLHFAMSLFYKEPEIKNHSYSPRLERVYEDAYSTYSEAESISKGKKEIQPLNTMGLIIMDLDGNEGKILGDLLVLGGLVGFNWEEIYQAYVNKNDKNYDRQLNVEGYK